MQAALAEPSAVRNGFTSVTRGTLLLLVATLCFIGENFVSRVILVRTLSQFQWTEFSLGLTLAGLLSAVGALGFPLAVARSLPFASSDAERRSVIRSSVGIVGVSAILVSSVLFLLAPSIGQALRTPLLGITLEFFSVSVGFTIISGLIASIFQGHEDVRPNAFFVQILNPSLFIVFLVVAYGAGSARLSYNQALTAYVLAAGITLGVLVAYTRWQLPAHLPPGPRESGVLGKLAQFAAPLFVVTVLAYGTGSADTLILAIYHNPQVGTYTASLALGRLLQIGIGSLGYIFLPVATKFLRVRDTDSVRITYATATKWMVLASLPLFLLFFFLPAPSLGFVYGPGYTSVTLPLQILVAGAFLSTLAGPSVSTQVSFGQTRLLLYNTVVTATVDVVLAFALTPSLGMVGAAVAWSVANALQPVLSMVELAFLEDVHPFRAHFLIPLLGTGLPLGVLFVFAPRTIPLWSLPVIGLGVAVVFVLVVLITGSVDRGDRLLLETVEGMLGRPLPVLRRLGGWRFRRG